jgi:hypothetical protein
MKATFQLWLILEKSSTGEGLGTGEGMVVAVNVVMGIEVVIGSGGAPQEGINNPIEISNKAYSSTFFI